MTDPALTSHPHLWAPVLRDFQSTASAYSWVDVGRLAKQSPRSFRLQDANETLPSNAAELQRALSSPLLVRADRSFLHVDCPSIVLPSFGISLTLSPPTVLDLGGGCCRPSPPVRAGELTAFYGKYAGRAAQAYVARSALGRWLKTANFSMLLGDASVVHTHLMSVVHSHSKGYHHAVTEAVPKVILALGLLRREPQIQVLYDADAGVEEVLVQLLGRREGRDLRMGPRAYFAWRLTIPPAFCGEGRFGPALSRAGTGAALRYLAAAADAAGAPAGGEATSASPPSTIKPRPTVLVVRRSVLASGGGRAALNHDELLLGLHHLLPPSVAIEEYAPDATLVQAARQWRRASLAICPHGAGTTNLIHMRPNGTVVELLAYGQKGRVYESLSHKMGHRYIVCLYNRTIAVQKSQLRFARVAGYTSFVVDVPAVLRCIQQANGFSAVGWTRSDARGGGLAVAAGKAARRISSAAKAQVVAPRPPERRSTKTFEATRMA